MATAQNTRNVTNEPLAEVLTRAQRLRLDNVAKHAGLTRQQMVRRGVELFLRQEAPVYLAEAKHAQS
jgi:predicted DNA-binding protein